MRCGSFNCFLFFWWVERWLWLVLAVGKSEWRVAPMMNHSISLTYQSCRQRLDGAQDVRTILVYSYFEGWSSRTYTSVLMQSHLSHWGFIQKWKETLGPPIDQMRNNHMHGSRAGGLLDYLLYTYSTRVSSLDHLMYRIFEVNILDWQQCAIGLNWIWRI